MSEISEADQLEEDRKYSRWYKNHLEQRKKAKEESAEVTPEKAAIIKLMSKEPAPHTQSWFYHNYAPQTADNEPHEVGEFLR